MNTFNPSGGPLQPVSLIYMRYLLEPCLDTITVCNPCAAHAGRVPISLPSPHVTHACGTRIPVPCLPGTRAGSIGWKYTAQRARNAGDDGSRAAER